MSELAAGVGNRRVMSYEASKFGKNSIFVWGLYGIASIWRNFFRHYFFPYKMLLSACLCRRTHCGKLDATTSCRLPQAHARLPLGQTC